MSIEKKINPIPVYTGRPRLWDVVKWQRHQEEIEKMIYEMAPDPAPPSKFGMSFKQDFFYFDRRTKKNRETAVNY